MSLTKVTNSMILGATYSAYDYGTIGSGDDSVAINAAITAASITGGIVQLDAINYAVTNPIVMKTNVTLCGMGIDKTIITQTGTVANWFSKSGFAVIQSPTSGEYSNVVLDGFTLQGLYVTPVPDGSTGAYAKSGIALANCYDSTIQNVKTTDTGIGIEFFGSVSGVVRDNNTIINCVVVNASSWESAGNPGTPRGIAMISNYGLVDNCFVSNSYTSFYPAGLYTTFSRCVASGWTDNGYYVNANNMTFDNCVAAISATGSGFRFNPSEGHVVTNCRAYECPNTGFIFHLNVDKSIFSNNTAVACGYGFYTDLIDGTYPAGICRGNTFTGNKAEANEYSGFRFDWMQDSSFVGNVAINNNQAGVTTGTRGGIGFGAYCTGWRVSDNLCVDTQGSPTQTFGLYSYPASVSGAATENTGNVINHKSVTGTDVFFPQSSSGTSSATITSGTRVVTESVSFSKTFETTPVVIAGVQNATVMADAERPISVSVYNVTTAGFSYIVDAYANVAANRAIAIGWSATT